MYACLAVTWHLHFWQNDRDFLRATVVTRGWNGYRNKSQHRKSTLEKKILPPFQQGFEPATFQSRVWRSNHWAIPSPLPACFLYIFFIASNLARFFFKLHIFFLSFISCLFLASDLACFLSFRFYLLFILRFNLFHGFRSCLFFSFRSCLFFSFTYCLLFSLRFHLFFGFRSCMFFSLFFFFFFSFRSCQLFSIKCCLLFSFRSCQLFSIKCCLFFSFRSCHILLSIPGATGDRCSQLIFYHWFNPLLLGSITVTCVWLNLFNVELSPKGYRSGPGSQEVRTQGKCNTMMSPPELFCISLDSSKSSSNISFIVNVRVKFTRDSVHKWQLFKERRTDVGNQTSVICLQ